VPCQAVGPIERPAADHASIDINKLANMFFLCGLHLETGAF
jgi:hypothetical protein